MSEVEKEKEERGSKINVKREKIKREGPTAAGKGREGNIATATVL